MKTKEYFKDSELACKCGCGAMPEEIAVERLYALRLIYRNPIRITSGKRCSDHNANIGGSKHSKHVAGIAFDCVVPKIDELNFICLAKLCGFNGVGFKDNIFVHIDARSTDAMWGY